MKYYWHYTILWRNRLEHIDGMFAFAIWDEKNQRAIFCIEIESEKNHFFYYWNV